MAFADFADQHQPIQLLQRSLQHGRLGHAYLFIGPALSELEAVARTLAKVLNCAQPIRSSDQPQLLDSCDRCTSCRKIDQFIHPDIQWVRPESKSRIITIDQVRDIIQTVNLKPSEAEYKLAVIVAADRMNVQAANAFLKTLEEPPPRSILILLSTHPQRLLETILSRCLRIHFAGEGQLQLEPGQKSWMHEFSQMAASAKNGGLLWRYRLLGTLLNRLAQLKAEIGKNLAACSPLERYPDAESKLQEKWEAELAAAVEAEYRRQRADLLTALQWWLRDIWLKKWNAPDLLAAFPEINSAAQSVAGRISPEEASQNLHILEHTQRLLASNVQEALALEVALLKLKL